MINFVFCFLFGAIIGVAGAVFAGKEEIDSIKNTFHRPHRRA